VELFARTVDPGERKSPSRDSDLRESLRYVEDFDEPRTPLAGCFSILLCSAAFRTDRGFFGGLAFFGSERKKLFAQLTGANFEVGDSLVIDVGG
jgi:hypothetical protein